VATSSLATVVEVGALVVVVYGVARFRPRPGRGWRPARPAAPGEPPPRDDGSAEEAAPDPGAAADPGPEPERDARAEGGPSRP